jgi:hypothetical protein
MESKMVGSCFALGKYPKWTNAITRAANGQSQPIDCSIFTNGQGMETSYFGGKKEDKWNSDPTRSPYNPRGFVCTSASETIDHNVNGALEKGFREMHVFKTIIARFVSCYTAQEDGGPLQCIKQKRIGSCKAYFMRNSAFDSRAAHVVSPDSNSTKVDWNKATAEWDATALKKGKEEVDTGKDPQLGLSSCTAAWKERLLSIL